MAKRKTFRAPGFKPLPNPIAAAFRAAPRRGLTVAARKGAGAYRRKSRNNRED